jgi:hypothetical protein
VTDLPRFDPGPITRRELSRRLRALRDGMRRRMGLVLTPPLVRTEAGLKIDGIKPFVALLDGYPGTGTSPYGFTSIHGTAGGTSDTDSLISGTAYEYNNEAGLGGTYQLIRWNQQAREWRFQSDRNSVGATRCLPCGTPDTDLTLTVTYLGHDGGGHFSIHTRSIPLILQPIPTAPAIGGTATDGKVWRSACVRFDDAQGVESLVAQMDWAFEFYCNDTKQLQNIAYGYFNTVGPYSYTPNCHGFPDDLPSPCSLLPDVGIDGRVSGVIAPFCPFPISHGLCVPTYGLDWIYQAAASTCDPFYLRYKTTTNGLIVTCPGGRFEDLTFTWFLDWIISE